MSEELLNFLSCVSLFENLAPEALRTLASRGAELSFRRGETICRQGEAGLSMFVITAGITEVYVEHDGRRQVLTHLRRGDYFGEMAMLTGMPRSASVRAVADTRVFGLTKEDFEDICRHNVDVALDIIRTLSLRLARRNVALDGRRAARVFVFLSFEPGIGRSSLAANMAVSLASAGAGRTALFDPNLASPVLPGIFGVDETVDLASTLLAEGFIDPGATLREVRRGLFLFPPQAREAPPLQEFHYHIPFQALRDYADVILVDSSSTIAGVNREIIKAAEKVIFLVSGGSSDLAGIIQQVERMVLAPANVSLDRLSLAVTSSGGGDVCAAQQELGVECLVLPEPEEPLREDSALYVEKHPEWELSRTVEAFAAGLMRGSEIKLFVPVTSDMDGESAKKAISGIMRRFPELFQSSGASGSAPVPPGAGSSDDVFIVLSGNAAVDELRDRLSSVMDCAGRIKDELGLDRLYLQVDGRVDTI